MGAQQQAITQGLGFLTSNEDRVLSVTRRMVGGEIQRLEIVIVGFDLRPFFHRVAHCFENRDDFIHGA